MYFHIDRENFRTFLDIINVKSSINTDILEKDYYVCEILKELSKNQEQLKAYFKRWDGNI